MSRVLGLFSHQSVHFQPQSHGFNLKKLISIIVKEQDAQIWETLGEKLVSTPIGVKLSLSSFIWAEL